MLHDPASTNPTWLPADPVRPFRHEGQAWRLEFPYKPLSSIANAEPRYAIPLPEIGISLDDHEQVIGHPYRV